MSKGGATCLAPVGSRTFGPISLVPPHSAPGFPFLNFLFECSSPIGSPRTGFPRLVPPELDSQKKFPLDSLRFLFKVPKNSFKVPLRLL